VNEEKVSHWFQVLGALLEECDVSQMPAHIWNLDTSNNTSPASGIDVTATAIWWNGAPT